MKIHITGVGGVAMGNLAAMLRYIGHDVTGSDRDLYPPMSERLKEWKIEAHNFDSANVKGMDLCIIGNVISRGNPEVEEILNGGIPYMSLPQALYEFFLKGRRVIVAAGTHGKTTTTFLTHYILSQAGIKAGLFAGGVRADGHDGFALPESDIFVIEGDEYDSAFFDKGSKFLHYRPRYLILGAVEFDHADIFRNYEEYALPFRRLLRMIPSNGLVVANQMSDGVRDVLTDYRYSPIEWIANQSKKGVFGFHRRAETLSLDGIGDIRGNRLMGDYNARNALAASRIALALGVSPKQIRDAVASFPGVMRRQQIRLEANIDGVPVTFIEDFAHHPTAVSETIDAVRQTYPDRSVSVLFEPRSATSHRNVFQKEYGAAFKRADAVYICEIHNKKKVGVKDRLDVKKILAGLKVKTKEFGRDPDHLLTRFTSTFKVGKEGSVVLVLSNGAFGGIYQKIETFLRDRSRRVR
jgi:UDP-N-acetylmuramate: L-alanyl-gamma-D-glutamyl-meso-diaminopimelate ligase